MRSKAVVDRFVRANRSSTAIELAVIAPVLFLFLLGTMLMGIGQFWQLVLDDATRNAVRQVEIGTVTSGTGFATAVCNEFGLAAGGCTSTLQYSVQFAPTFSGATGITPATVNAAGALSSPAFFGIPISNAPVLAQTAFILPINIILVPQSLVTMNGTQAIISSVSGVHEYLGTP